eukprot:1703614-Pyramimonas_sp.AAC.1
MEYFEGAEAGAAAVSPPLRVGLPAVQPLGWCRCQLAAPDGEPDQPGGEPVQAVRFAVAWAGVLAAAAGTDGAEDLAAGAEAEVSPFIHRTIHPIVS